MDPSSDLTDPVPTPAALPVPRGGPGRLVASHRDQLPVRSVGAGTTQVVTELAMSPGLSRQECWRRLPPRVADRMIDLAGDQVEWWANVGPAVDDRPNAVLIGAAGVCFADARVNSQQLPVYAVNCYQLNPGSFRHATVAHRPDPAPTRRVTAPAGPPAVDLPGLNSSASTLLGNLPPRAQQLLRAPFSTTEPVLRCDWYYTGTDHQLSFFAVVLAGAQHVTMATGTRVTPVGHTEQTAHWSLTCGRATVVRRIGR